jgi:hypothetical protein
MNYSLDTPIKRKLYKITEDDVPFAPAYQPPHTSETDQTHRNMTWLHHKPSISKITQESGRDKKK